MSSRKRGGRAARSMEETISGWLVCIGLLAMVLTASLTLLMFHRAFDKQLRLDVRRQAENLAQALRYLPGSSSLEDFAGEGIRVTLVRPDGEVLFDSDVKAGGLENHLSRPEIQSALQSGAGEAQRTSGTLGYSTYYYALRLENGDVLRLAIQAENFYAIYDSALPAVVVALVVILFLAVVISLLLTRRLVRPIETMAENLDDLEGHLPYKELEPFAMALQRDRQALHAGEKMRQEFTANVSHELKTPLTSISGYAELIESGMAKPEDVPLFAGRIHAEAGRLLNLIRDIIQLTQLDQPPAQPEFGPVDLQQVCQACIKQLALNAQKAYVTLNTEGTPQIVHGNRAMLEELCYNLCDNAIRYNRPGGRVAVTTGRGTGGAFLRVSDTGIGIPHEHQQRVFERFYRVDKSRSKATGGTGLGLAIVKHCALQHSATIFLESEPGKGTTITVTFPDAK